VKAGALCLAIIAAVSVAPAATVAINPATEYQTIEGFGGFGLDIITTQSYLDKLITDLGVTMIRTNTADAAQSVDDWARFVNAYNARAQALGEPIRWICSTWSPPANMKVNNSVSGTDAATNKLKPEYYDDYAIVVRNFLTTMKQRTSTDYYAVSFQNEPAFPESYWSCVYTASEYRDMIKIAGPIVHAAHPNIKVFGAEDMLSRWTAMGAFPGPLMADAASKAQMGALAVHGYSDGVHPTPASSSVSLWNAAARNCASAGMPLWMTETSGYSSAWNDAFHLGEMIYVALKYGKLAAWVWWTISGSDDGYHIMVGENPTNLYYVHKHYARYIRPDARMISATSSDSLVFSVGFHHKTNNTLTIVLLNAKSTAETVTITGSDLPTFQRYLSTSSVHCADQGTTGATDISLPANSIATLCGQNYEPVVGVDRQVTRGRGVSLRRVNGSRVGAETFTLRGERLGSGAVHAAGVTLERQIFSDGTAAVSPIADSR